jgi:hypothetical protein
MWVKIPVAGLNFEFTYMILNQQPAEDQNRKNDSNAAIAGNSFDLLTSGL